MQGNNYTYFGIGCRMALFIVYSDRTHLGCIITPTLSVTSLHGMAKNGKNQKGKELNSILGETSRNMLLFGVLLAFGLIL